MQACKEIIQSIGIDFVVFYTDEGSIVTLQMRRLTRDAQDRASPVRTLKVFLSIFRLAPIFFFNLMRLFVRYDTVQWLRSLRVSLTVFVLQQQQNLGRRFGTSKL